MWIWMFTGIYMFNQIPGHPMTNQVNIKISIIVGLEILFICGYLLKFSVHPDLDFLQPGSFCQWSSVS